MVRSICLLLVLGLALPTFGDDAQPMKSILLVARKNLPDPFFRDSVVLVTRSAGLAPVGVIVNRPTDVPLSSVFPDIERLRLREEILFFGGPVACEQLVVVFRAAVPPTETIEVLEVFICAQAASCCASCFAARIPSRACGYSLVMRAGRRGSWNRRLHAAIRI